MFLSLVSLGKMVVFVVISIATQKFDMTLPGFLYKYLLHTIKKVPSGQLSILQEWKISINDDTGSLERNRGILTFYRE